MLSDIPATMASHTRIDSVAISIRDKDHGAEREAHQNEGVQISMA
jgi:hypothetical protein